jgi:hypothetical protein
MATFSDLNDLVATYPARWGYVEKDSITTVANSLSTLWRATGRPGVGDKPGTINGAACSRTTLGAAPLLPPSGGKSTFTNSLALFASQPGVFQIIDRVWHSDSLSMNSAGAQAIAFSGLPSRAAGGSGLELGFEIWTATGAVAVSPSVSYTDATGGNGSGRTATMPASAVPASAIAARFFPLTLASGDTGVSSIASCTTGLALSGEGGLVLYRTLFEVTVASSSSAQWHAFPETGLLQIPDDACLSLLELVNGTSTGKVRLSYATVQKVLVP